MCYKNGCKYEVVIDNHLPCRERRNVHEPKFSRGNGPELWVIMMEKAWAKIHGSYDRIVSGTVYLTLRDLTGAPGFQISDIKKEENLFEKIKNWDNNNYMMSASIHA